MLLEVMRLAEDLGVGFAFPTQTLHVDSLAESAATALVTPPSNEDLAKAIEAFAPNGSQSRPVGKPLTHGYLPE